MCCGGHVFPFYFVFFRKKILFLLFFNRDREKCVVEGMCFLFALFFLGADAQPVSEEMAGGTICVMN